MRPNLLPAGRNWATLGKASPKRTRKRGTLQYLLKNHCAMASVVDVPIKVILRTERDHFLRKFHDLPQPEVLWSWWSWCLSCFYPLVCQEHDSMFMDCRRCSHMFHRRSWEPPARIVTGLRMSGIIRSGKAELLGLVSQNPDSDVTLVYFDITLYIYIYIIT